MAAATVDRCRVIFRNSLVRIEFRGFVSEVYDVKRCLLFEHGPFIEEARYIQLMYIRPPGSKIISENTLAT